MYVRDDLGPVALHFCATPRAPGSIGRIAKVKRNKEATPLARARKERLCARLWLAIDPLDHCLQLSSFLSSASFFLAFSEHSLARPLFLSPSPRSFYPFTRYTHFFSFSACARTRLSRPFYSASCPLSLSCSFSPHGLCFPFLPASRAYIQLIWPLNAVTRLARSISLIHFESVIFFRVSLADRSSSDD